MTSTYSKDAQAWLAAIDAQRGHFNPTTRKIAGALAALGGSMDVFATSNAILARTAGIGKGGGVTDSIRALASGGFLAITTAPGRGSAPTAEYRLLLPKAREVDPLDPAPAVKPPASALTPPVRRLIFEKLGDVYDEKAGYTAGWSEARLAEAIRCPRAFVAEVRMQMFGPLKVRADFSAELAMTLDRLGIATDRLDAIDKAQKEASELLAEIEKDRLAARNGVQEIRAEIDGLRRKVRDLAAEVGK